MRRLLEVGILESGLDGGLASELEIRGLIESGVEYGGLGSGRRHGRLESGA